MQNVNQYFAACAKKCEKNARKALLRRNSLPRASFYRLTRLFYGDIILDVYKQKL